MSDPEVETEKLLDIGDDGDAGVPNVAGGDDSGAKSKAGQVAKGQDGNEEGAAEGGGEEEPAAADPLGPTEHVVKDGESLNSIAASYDLTPSRWEHRTRIKRLS